MRDRLPDHDPYRAWANFEFIADDGSISEVDLLVLTTKGFYLVEIKPARHRGCTATAEALLAWVGELTDVERNARAATTPADVELEP